MNVQPFIVTENPDEAADAVKKWGSAVLIHVLERILLCGFRRGRHQSAGARRRSWTRNLHEWLQGWCEAVLGVSGLGITPRVSGILNCACSENEAREIASKMIGQTLVTKQTGADGVLVKKVRLPNELLLLPYYYLYSTTTYYYTTGYYVSDTFV